VDAILSPTLPDEVLADLEQYFGHVNSVSGN
ncbi:MAG: hypothetical protein ACI9Z9_002885, partial [Litorivivens sp.]